MSNAKIARKRLEQDLANILTGPDPEKDEAKLALRLASGAIRPDPREIAIAMYDAGKRFLEQTASERPIENRSNGENLH